ncbi:MAG: hypothetical protein QE271_12280 [Bacteriovoracaceae bacterium]|nr:hypothetical protein [Bacteriovoracaceae bacterium]
MKLYSINLLLSCIAVISCSTMNSKNQIVEIRADDKFKIATNSQQFLLQHPTTIAVTDPDPTGTFLVKYLTKFERVAVKRKIAHEIHTHCDFHEALKNYQCYLEQKVGPKYFESFHFVINDEKDISNITSVAICTEKTPQLDYKSPECPIHLKN